MEKKELREKYKSLREELSNRERYELSEQILEKCLGNFSLEGKTISVFLPIERLGEIITWPILDRIAARFVLPVVRNEELQHIVFEDKKQLLVSDWGIPEPVYGDQLDEKEIDVVLVPMLVGDMNGNRVGYGKGFYDRFLANCREDCLFIGLCYYDPVDRIEDIHPSDVSLKYIITPSKVYAFQ